MDEQVITTTTNRHGGCIILDFLHRVKTRIDRGTAWDGIREVIGIAGARMDLAFLLFSTTLLLAFSSFLACLFDVLRYTTPRHIMTTYRL